MSNCNECWFANECVEFDGELLGEASENISQIRNDWISKGWLSENGVCNFPPDVQAHPSGVITRFPISWWATANEAGIKEAIDSGSVIFVDGNGDKYTLTEYRAKYPNYPDALYVLRLEKRFPPNPDSYIDLDDPDVQQEWVKIVFRPMM